MQMTLREFMSFDMPREDFIVLIDNPEFIGLGDRFAPGGEAPDRDAILVFAGPGGKSPDRRPDFPLLTECLTACARRPHRRYVVVNGKCPVSITRRVSEMIPDNVARLYANNVEVEHPKVRALPLGRDFRNSEVIRERRFPLPADRKLCYCNFSLNTSGERHRIYHRLRDRSWITFQHMGEWLNYPIPREQFLADLSAHRFVISPEGVGRDCFRTWDAIYQKSVPIVQRSDAMEHFARLPILFTRSYRELTPDYLERMYAEMLDRTYDFNLLRWSYWRSLIDDDLSSPAPHPMAGNRPTLGAS